MHGDNVEYLHEQQKVVGTGNVSIDYEDTKLTADKITVHMDTKLAIAEGNVVLKQKGSIFKGARAEYDFGKKIGNVSQMEAEIEPTYFGKAERIERVAVDHYRAKNVSVTTCCGESPFYTIHAQDIDIYPGKKVVIKNAVVRVKGVPIFYLPIYVQPLFDFERFPAQVVPGKNQEWGAFMLSKWRYNLVSEPDLSVKGNLQLDYRERRGVGVGAEGFYKGDKVGRGAVKVYGIDDKKPPANIDSERYRAQWRHQSKLAEDTTLTLEANKLADRDVIKDFMYREEYETNALPDNYVSIIKARPEYTLSLLDRERFDDFYSVTERSPELRFDTYNRRFAETPFYFREEMQFSNLHRKAAGSDEGSHATRFDTNHTLTYAGRVGAISIDPHVGTRQTYYSRNVTGGDTDFVRGTFDGGVDLSTRFYKTYDAYVKSFGLDYNQLRHIFTPTLSYHYRPNPTVPRTVLQQFDALDSIDKQNFIRFNFENKIQTKEHQKDGLLVAREIARVIPFFDTDLHTGRLENVGYDAEFRPYTWLGIESDATYNARTRDIATANFDLHFTKDKYEMSVGQRYLQNESSQTTAQFRWKLRQDLEIRLYERYEFQTKEPKETEVTLTKEFNCLIVDFTYNHRDGDTFFFVFRLKGFPRASFSLSKSYTQPKASAPSRPLG